MFNKIILPWFVWGFYFLWSSTWRKQRVEHPKFQEALANNSSLILAHWHGDELAVLHLVKTYRLATMTSTSKDGALIDFVIKRLGGATSRGSSTRGSLTALRGLLRLMKKGYRASIAVDGPRGPIYQVKPGVFELSRLANAMIVPVGVATKKPIVSKKSWNKAILPRLFSRVVMTFGEPLPALGREQSAKDYKLAEKLKNKLIDAKGQAANLIAQG